MANLRQHGLIWYLNERGQIRCWCCLGSGEDERGSECAACDGSGHMPDTTVCHPLCREQSRTLPLQAR